MPKSALIVLGLALLAGGCGGGAAGDRGADAADPSVRLPGVYTGTFPCSDCDGLDAALWLRADGTFFTRQRHPDTAGGEALGYNLGRWRFDVGERVLVLTGAGPERRFSLAADGALALEVASPLEHVLRRDTSAPPEPTDVIPIDGLATVDGSSVRLTECLSGLTVGLGDGPDYTRLRRRLQSSVGTRGTALVALEGRFLWSRDGAPAGFSVERFHALEPGGVCPR